MPTFYSRWDVLERSGKKLPFYIRVIFPHKLLIFSLSRTHTHFHALSHSYPHTHSLSRTHKYTHFWYFYHFSSHSIQQKWCTWNERDFKIAFKKKKKDFKKITFSKNVYVAKAVKRGRSNNTWPSRGKVEITLPNDTWRREGVNQNVTWHFLNVSNHTKPWNRLCF